MSQDKAIFKNLNAKPQDRQAVNRPQKRQPVKKVSKSEVNLKTYSQQKDQKDETPELISVPKKKSSFRLDFGNKSVLSGVIFSELLGKPKSLRRK